MEFVDDNFIEDDEFFDVCLQNPSFGIVDASFGLVRETLVIADNDSKTKHYFIACQSLI